MHRTKRLIVGFEHEHEAKAFLQDLQNSSQLAMGERRGERRTVIDRGVRHWMRAAGAAHPGASAELHDPIVPAAQDWEGEAAGLIFAKRKLSLAEVGALLGG